jgi:hypothetical protein
MQAAARGPLGREVDAGPIDDAPMAPTRRTGHVVVAPARPSPPATTPALTLSSRPPAHFYPVRSFSFHERDQPDHIFDRPADPADTRGMREIRTDGSANDPGALRTAWPGATRVQMHFCREGDRSIRENKRPTAYISRE